jgi:hypothetical protein
MQVLENPMFLGQTGERTVFVIELTQNQARDITQYSLVGSEDEVVLPPGCRFTVLGVLPQRDLTIIQLREVPSKEWIMDLSNPILQLETIPVCADGADCSCTLGLQSEWRRCLNDQCDFYNQWMHRKCWNRHHKACKGHAFRDGTFQICDPRRESESAIGMSADQLARVMPHVYSEPFLECTCSAISAADVSVIEIALCYEDWARVVAPPA